MRPEAPVVIHPPHRGAQLLLCKAQALELFGRQGLPRDCARAVIPAGGEPVRARGAEAAVSVEDKQAGSGASHARTVTMCRDAAAYEALRCRPGTNPRTVET